MTIRSYRDLTAWQRAMALAEGCYRFTEGCPKSEVFGLAAHIGKTAVSIPSNLAEGRRSTAAYASHLAIAMGSQAELETQIELARRLGMGKPASADRLLDDSAEIGRILNGLRQSLDAKVKS